MSTAIQSIRANAHNDNDICIDILLIAYYSSYTCTLILLLICVVLHLRFVLSFFLEFVLVFFSHSSYYDISHKLAQRHSTIDTETLILHTSTIAQRAYTII